MNSPLALPSVHTNKDLVRFDHPDQWQSRPAWLPHINASDHELNRIIGGYNLGRDLWQHCGLCNHLHGRGYVVATTEGVETHIGKDCGQRHLGAHFEELERQFTLVLEAHDRMKRLQNLVSRREQLRSDAQALLAECKSAERRLQDFRERIFREPTLASVYRNAAAADGVVYVERRLTEDEFQLTRMHFERKAVARIDGHTALTSPSPVDAIQIQVLPFAASLNQDMLLLLNDKAWLPSQMRLTGPPVFWLMRKTI